MPEIDIDTFQVLALLLLVAAVALSALALITVTRLRDELLDREPFQEPRPGSSAGYPSAYTPQPTETFPRTSSPLTPSTQAPAWASGRQSEPAGGGYASEPSAARPAPTGGYEPPRTEEPATAYEPAPSTAYQPTAETAYEPSGGGLGSGAPEPASAASVTGPSSLETAAAEPIPEEQPFERDGRWWYKRGDELLVYDEGSGQWETAPDGSLGFSPQPQMPESRPSAASEYASVGATPAGSPGGAVHDDPGGFWKCTSCGAINGSTAGSCRMCFAAHP